MMAIATIDVAEVPMKPGPVHRRLAAPGTTGGGGHQQLVQTEHPADVEGACKLGLPTPLWEVGGQAMEWLLTTCSRTE